MQTNALHLWDFVHMYSRVLCIWPLLFALLLLLFYFILFIIIRYVTTVSCILISKKVDFNLILDWDNRENLSTVLSNI
jgi:hypothetical protein